MSHRHDLEYRCPRHSKSSLFTTILQQIATKRKKLEFLYIIHVLKIINIILVNFLDKVYVEWHGCEKFISIDMVPKSLYPVTWKKLLSPSLLPCNNVDTNNHQGNVNMLEIFQFPVVHKRSAKKSSDFNLGFHHFFATHY